MKKARLDGMIEQAVHAPTGIARRSIAAKARSAMTPKKSVGAPSKFTESAAQTICRDLANGKTVTRIAESLGITPDCIYGWLKKYPSFAESYQQAREGMARSLVDQLLDEAKETEPDKAMLLKVRGGIIQWAVSRFNPKEFSDSRRIELKGEITHRHTHELAPEQKRRIAESWLISQQPDTLGITAETTGPDLQGVLVVEPEQREIPKRKKVAVKKPPIEVDSSGTWRGH